MGGQLKTNKVRKRILKEASALLVDIGGRCWLASPIGNRGHHRLMIELNGVSRFCPVPGTPTDEDFAVQYTMRDVKRIIKEINNASMS